MPSKRAFGDRASDLGSGHRGWFLLDHKASGSAVLLCLIQEQNLWDLRTEELGCFGEMKWGIYYAQNNFRYVSLVGSA